MVQPIIYIYHNTQYILLRGVIIEIDLPVLGSLCFDTVKTQHGERTNQLGGSAIFASIAASKLCKPGILGIAGEDFIETKNGLTEVCCEGIEIRPGGTFRWTANYDPLTERAHSVDRQFMAMMGKPKVPESYKKCEFLLLGNHDPKVQLDTLREFSYPRLVMADTMDTYIESDRDHVLEVVCNIDVFILNSAEATQLTGKQNTVSAGKYLLEYGGMDSGVKTVIIKKGEHGAIMFNKNTGNGYETFIVPALLSEKVIDPTGAGDSFAGGFIGWIAKTHDISPRNQRKAMLFGAAAASFTIEDFGTTSLRAATTSDLYDRYMKLQDIMSF